MRTPGPNSKRHVVSLVPHERATIHSRYSFLEATGSLGLRWRPAIPVRGWGRTPSKGPRLNHSSKPEASVHIAGPARSARSTEPPGLSCPQTVPFRAWDDVLASRFLSSRYRLHGCQTSLALALGELLHLCRISGSLVGKVRQYDET